jgi:hypothetical protein
VLDQKLSKKKIKKNHGNPSLTGQNTLSYLFPAPKLNSAFAPFCEFQTTIDAYGA